LDVIKRHKHKATSSVNFSFRKYQEQFEAFWDERIEKLTDEEKEMLCRLQNKSSEIFAYEESSPSKRDMTRQLNTISELMRAEF
jgi:hypothetical protein